MLGSITIVGLGPGDPGLLTLGAMDAMKGCGLLLLRTERHPTVGYLRENGIGYEPLDMFYEKGRSFNEVYESIADHVVGRASEGMAVCFAVPGDPWTGELTTPLIVELCDKAGIPVEVRSAVSFFEPLSAAAGLDPFSGLLVLDGTTLKGDETVPWTNVLVCQVYSRMVASSVKLALLEAYPPEHAVKVIKSAGNPDQSVTVIPLFTLDHGDVEMDHLTTVLVPALEGAIAGMSGAKGGNLPMLTDIMATLRSPGGCPWDFEQTHDSLKPYVIEEAYEVLEAIESGKVDKLVEELGDLLLQVVFHARVAEETGDFDMNDVVRGISEKLIRRHPHVFGDVSVSGAKDVLVNWERIKGKEKGNEDRKSILDGIPVHLPALMKADKIQSKAAKVGFDWDKPEDALEKVWEESEEFKEAFASGSMDRMEDEMGDLFFAIVNVARLMDIEPEAALRRTIDKFSRRFRHIEKVAGEKGVSLDDMTLPEMDAIWNEAKKLPTLN